MSAKDQAYSKNGIPGRQLQTPNEFRAEIQAALIENGWCVRELQRAIREKLGVRRKAGAGRPLKTPKNVKAALIHSAEQAKKFAKANAEIWFGDAYDIPEAVADIPSDLLTDELKTQLSEAAEQYDKVNEITAKNAQLLRGALADVDSRMKAQEECDLRIQAEEEAEAAACAAAG